MAGLKDELAGLSTKEKLKLAKIVRAMYVKEVANGKVQLYPKELRELNANIARLGG